MIAEIDLGVCLLCGKEPEYNSDGHRGFADFHILHACPKLPGSPYCVFTVDAWIKGVDPFHPIVGGSGYLIGKRAPDEGFTT